MFWEKFEGLKLKVWEKLENRVKVAASFKKEAESLKFWKSTEILAANNLKYGCKLTKWFVASIVENSTEILKLKFV